MNRDDICDFYLQVSKEFCDGKEWCIAGISEPLQRFAVLVAAHERERLVLPSFQVLWHFVSLPALMSLKSWS